MLIQFFAESGLMVFIVAVFPLVLLEFGLDEQLVAIISTWGASFGGALFFLLLLAPLKDRSTGEHPNDCK